MEIYSTSAFHQNKAAEWSRLNSDVFAHMAFNAGNARDFEAELRMASLGPLLLSWATSFPASINRTEEHVSQGRERRFFLNIVMEGRAAFTQYGREAVLNAGDFVLGDSAVPAGFTFHEPVQLLGLRIPGEIIRGHVPVPERLCGLHMSGSQGFGHTATHMMMSVWDQLESTRTAEFAPTIARHLLDVVATAYAMTYDTDVDETAVASARRARIKRFVEEHLHAPDLSPAMIAGAFRISPRYLRMIFADEAETISKYILRRRLEECAQQMTNVFWRGHTITEIAFNWGFNSTAHFTRVFRDHFGTTPRDYRQARLGQ